MMEEEFETPDPHGPVLVSMWIGAAALWMFNGFKGRLTSQLNNKSKSRNIWVGYLVQLLVIAVLVYFIYKK